MDIISDVNLCVNVKLNIVNIVSLDSGELSFGTGSL